MLRRQWKEDILARKRRSSQNEAREEKMLLWDKEKEKKPKEKRKEIKRKRIDEPEMQQNIEMSPNNKEEISKLKCVGNTSLFY